MQQSGGCDSCSTRTVYNNFSFVNFAVCDEKSIYETSKTNNSGSVLVIVEDGNGHQFLESFLNDETVRRLDVFKIYATEAGS